MKDTDIVSVTKDMVIVTDATSCSNIASYDINRPVQVRFYKV